MELVFFSWFPYVFVKFYRNFGWFYVLKLILNHVFTEFLRPGAYGYYDVYGHKSSEGDGRVNAEMSTHKVPLYCCWLPPNIHYGIGVVTVMTYTLRHGRESSGVMTYFSDINAENDLSSRNSRREKSFKHRCWIVAPTHRWTMVTVNIHFVLWSNNQLSSLRNTFTCVRMIFRNDKNKI